MICNQGMVNSGFAALKNNMTEVDDNMTEEFAVTSYVKPDTLVVGEGFLILLMECFIFFGFDLDIFPY